MLRLLSACVRSISHATAACLFLAAASQITIFGNTGITFSVQRCTVFLNVIDFTYSVDRIAALIMLSCMRASRMRIDHRASGT